MIYDYLNTYGAANAYSASSASATSGVSTGNSLLDLVGGSSASSYAGGSDSVDISSTARELIERIKSLDVFSCIYPDNNASKNAYSLSDIENDFTSDFTSFVSMFGGLAGDGSVSMGLDGKGGMIIEGDEKSAQAVSSAVTSTSTARFAVMAARAALMDAGKTVDGFAGAYASDPYAAIRENIDALGDRLLGFRAQVGGGSAQYGFVGGAGVDYVETAVA